MRIMDKTLAILVLIGIILGSGMNVSAAPMPTPSPDFYCHLCMDAAADNEACNKTQRCDQGSGCLTSIWYDGDRTVLQKRCTSKQICSSMERHNDKVCYNMDEGFDGICSFCCDTPGCNKHIPNSAIPGHKSSHNDITPQHPTQPTLSPSSVFNNQVTREPCTHHNDDHGVVSVNGGNGMKISINLEFPSGVFPPQPPCGCQTTSQPTHQTDRPYTPTYPTTTNAAVTPTASMTPYTTTTTTNNPTTSTTDNPKTISTTNNPTTISTSTHTTEITTASTTETTTTTTTPPTTTPEATTPTPTTTSTTTTTVPVATTVTTDLPTLLTTTTTPKALVTTTAGPAGPKCYTCTDKSCQTQTLTTCHSQESLCMNTISQDIQGKRTFSKGCASKLVCKEDWFVRTSGLADCFLLDDKPVGETGMVLNKCSFCCTGDRCNQRAVPMDKLWYNVS